MMSVWSQASSATCSSTVACQFLYLSYCKFLGVFCLCICICILSGMKAARLPQGSWNTGLTTDPCSSLLLCQLDLQLGQLACHRCHWDSQQCLWDHEALEQVPWPKAWASKAPLANLFPTILVVLVLVHPVLGSDST